jgi:hypothetical protein
MWFDVFDPEKANATIDHLASWDQAADWGMRIISQRNPLYGPTGYHYGSVWPLFTGWASVAEYRNHRPLEAYANLRANSLLALNGSLGHVTEVLSGAYYEGLGTASPHQIWSSAMVLSPAIRGMLGLSVDEANKSVMLAPHIPADWNDFALHGVSACGGKYDIAFHRTAGALSFNVTGSGSGCSFTISPAVSKHARILGATLNSRKLGYKVDQNENDQHIAAKIDSTGEVSFQIANDFGLVADADLPELGAPSSNLKISHEQWSPDRRQLTVRVAGLSGQIYLLRAYGAKMLSVSGGDLKPGNGEQIIEIAVPPTSGAEEYVGREISIRF